MINLKTAQRIGLVIIGFVTCMACIFFTQPSKASTTTYRHMLALGLVDEITTPQKIGLDYLAHQPTELIAISQLMNSIINVCKAASRMPEDISLAIPLGTNSPIGNGQLPNDSGTPKTGNYEATGFINPQGQAKNITPNDVADMTKTEVQNGGNLPSTAEAQNIRLADASGRFYQARRLPVFNLIVRDRRTGQRSVIKKVNANAFCRDVLNAFLNRTYRRI
ncbi:hypothetical protein Cylst_5521 [Cylindrospermum stagnale PCC 7417]|uniref:Uncharacterized protein n=1 Tax=Cylindrospermum stagnale PCC 7417 TaxID=56107 RepID=K9X7B0_9NOST|nr:hypothetical protein [Cylindrospermum stagnale]AFZ27532.1 hypothetical protein Cylst_5521 [Cylindrospermum stagnale PCC 7417]